jgi:hypothetical protein
MLRLFRRKIIFVVSFSEKNDFLEKNFSVLFARKNYEMQKSEFGKCSHALYLVYLSSNFFFSISLFN